LSFIDDPIHLKRVEKNGKKKKAVSPEEVIGSSNRGGNLVFDSSKPFGGGLKFPERSKTANINITFCSRTIIV
jgi:hypothetical protein